MISNRRFLGRLLLSAAFFQTNVWATWDGDPSLDDIDFSLESFIDLGAYQFRPSEEIAWQGVENGLRIAAGSFSTNLLYLNTELRLKQEITPEVIFRLQLVDEEFYEPREFPRPQLEMEYYPTALPVSISLIGTPAYAKREADLGLAVTLGQRPWNYFRVAWLNQDTYFNDKNDLDEARYRREPGQLTLEAAYQWKERYKVRLWWQDNTPLEFVLDDQTSLFAYENSNYRLNFDYLADSRQQLGISLRGFETSQSLAEGVESRSQDIRYFSVDGYWVRRFGQGDEWTVGLRYDDFLNEERTPAELSTSFDFAYKTAQIYTIYHHPYRPTQAWEVKLNLGQAERDRDYLDSSIADLSEERVEAKLSLGWELFSRDRSKALTVAGALNLDELGNDAFDGGAVRFRSSF